ncbi:MAG TPA: NosD domain-containing protein [Candidatus Acidoferrum sp.]|nr:NosD domain-containing protein [Candidatus Acidoferrum sp.]
MKVQFSFKLFCVLTLLLGLLLLPAGLFGAATPQLVVDDDKVQCPDAAFTKIQDAVNAATPGAVIRVCKGTYAEQVAIHKSLTIAADSGAVLMPGTMQQNATSLFDGTPLAAAILVSDTTDVTIDGLTVDGSNNGVVQCSPRLFGIAFQNASGQISRAAIRNFKLGTSLGGCQSGSGVFVQSGGGGISNVEIEKSTIHDFQKNGITADEVGTQVSVHGNVVTGIGPTSGAAQNGIQIGFGAGGSISRNTVTNNFWSPCTAVDTCTAVATNILVTQSDGVEVSDNRAGISQVAIFVHGNQGLVAGNETFASSVFDGIRIEGDGNRARRNQVFNGAEAGIFVVGNNNVVEHNKITEAAIGILKQAGSLGNVIRFNQVFDAPVAVQDPATPGLAKAILPER